MSAVTNFQQWNPGGVNQDTDSQYAADSQRVGGAPNGAAFPSQTANKFMYQQSTMTTALAIMLQNKGYSTSDSDIYALAAVLANILTTADLGFLTTIVSVAFSTTPTFDCSLGSQFYIVLTGAVASSRLINLQPGRKISMMIAQDGNGSHPFAWPTNIVNPGSIAQGQNQTSYQEFEMWPDGLIRACSGVMVA